MGEEKGCCPCPGGGSEAGGHLGSPPVLILTPKPVFQEVKTPQLKTTELEKMTSIFFQG